MANYEQGAKESLKIFLDFINASIRDATGIPKSLVDDYTGKGLNVEIMKMKGGEKSLEELSSYASDNEIRFIPLEGDYEAFTDNLKQLGVGYAIIGVSDGQTQLAYHTNQRHLVEHAGKSILPGQKKHYELDDGAANELFRNKKVNTMVITGVELHLLRKYQDDFKVTYGVFDPNIHKKDEDYVLIFDNENSARMERALNSIIQKSETSFSKDDMLNISKEMSRSERLRNDFIDMASELGHGKVMYSISKPGMRIENIEGNLTLYDNDNAIEQLFFDPEDKNWAEKMYVMVDKLDLRTVMTDIDSVKDLSLKEIEIRDMEQFHNNAEIMELYNDFMRIADIPVSSRVESVKFKDNTIEDMSVTVHKKASKNKHAR